MKTTPISAAGGQITDSCDNVRAKGARVLIDRGVVEIRTEVRA